MAFDTLYIGSVPCEEDCAQVGLTHDAQTLNRIECKHYIQALRRVYGNEPENTYFAIVGESHDFGTYYEVAVKYNDEDSTACELAYWIEDNLPVTWNDNAILNRESVPNDKPGILARHIQTGTW